MPDRTNHFKVAEHIRSRIKNQGLQVGDKLPSFTQLRRQLGAARATVSRAMRTLESDGVVERRSRSGVFVAAPQLRKLSLRIGLATSPIGDFASDYWARFFVGIQSMAAPRGIEIAFIPGLERVDWRDYDGLLGFDLDQNRGNYGRPNDLPTVSIGPAFETPSVSVNDYDAAFLATTHLIDLGHRRIGFFGQLPVGTACVRLAGYHAAHSLIWPEWVETIRPYLASRAAAHGEMPAYDDRLVRSMGWLSESTTGYRNFGRAFMENWLKEGFRDLDATALLVQNDLYAEGVMDALAQHGIRVPGDVSVVGFDNESRCAMMSPTLTSVGCDMADLGARALKMLLDLVDGAEVTNVTVPVRLYRRESTAPPGGPFVA